VRSYLVFELCTVQPLVRHAPALLAAAKAAVGPGLVAAALRATFFAHFCAGEDAETIKPTLARLRAAGVGGILDYAAEADVAEGGGGGGAAAPAAHPDAELDANLAETVAGLRAAQAAGGFAAVKVTALAAPELLARVSEELEAARRAFRALARAARGAPAAGDDDAPALYLDTRLGPDAFAAALAAVAAEHALPALPRSAGGDAAGDAAALFRLLDVDGDGAVSYLDWLDATGVVTRAGPATDAAAAAAGAAAAAAAARAPSPAALAAALGLAARSARPGAPPGAPAAAGLSDADARAWAAVHRRAAELATAARQLRVTVMVDAEQSYLQPAIEAVGVAAARRANRPGGAQWAPPEYAHAAAAAAAAAAAGGGGAAWPYAPPAALAAVNERHAPGGGGAYPAVYNTFQGYLRDAPLRVELSIARARRDGFLFGAKLVRGAYMAQERARAAALGYADPIHATLADTHACYHGLAERVLDAVVAPRGGEVMVASHNEGTVARVAAGMAARGLAPATCGVSFGQLLGMCDATTLSLGRAGYAAFKYVPYGPVLAVMPYLIRRAQENSDVVAGGVGKELAQLRGELRKRLVGV